MSTTKANLFLSKEDLVEVEGSVIGEERLTAVLNVGYHHSIYFDSLDAVRGFILALRYLEADYANTLNMPKDTDEQD